jgi:hypothetical protein
VVALQSTLLAKRLKASEPIKSCLPAFTTGAFLVCPISDSHFVGTALFSARPIHTKDGGTLRTVLDAQTYMLALSEDRERQQWQRACKLLLAEADIDAFSKQLELAFLRCHARSAFQHMNR